MEMTLERHAQHVGMLIEQLQTVEYSARVAIKILSQDKSPHVDFARLHEGDWVPEDAVTNYDQLDAVLKRFNELAPPRWKVDAARLVDLRHQLAHGRLVAGRESRETLNLFPLVTVKFGKPRSGWVQVTAFIEMTERWFSEQRAFLHQAVEAVMFAQGPALYGDLFAQLGERQTDNDPEGGRR